jgi:hypothetical protein
MKNAFCAVLLALVFATTSRCAYADNNSFFGANPGGGSGNSNSNASSNSSNTTDYSKDLPEDNNPNAVLPGLNETTPSKPNNMTDFTGDEKRMQKKYKSNITNAEHLILRGTNMMKGAGNNTNSPIFKKGKILKEIGEKSLAELKANNPFPDQKIK